MNNHGLLEKVSLNVAVSLIGQLLAAGFDEKQLRELIERDEEAQPCGSIYHRRGLSVLRDLLFVAEGLSEIKRCEDPLLKIPRNAKSYSWGAMRVDMCYDQEESKDLRLSQFGLVSPFLDGEEELRFEVGLKRVGEKHTLATPFEYGWFVQHPEFIPDEWRPFKVMFGGFPVKGNFGSKKGYYPALRFRDARWDQCEAPGEGYVMLKSSYRFVAIK